MKALSKLLGVCICSLAAPVSAFHAVAPPLSVQSSLPPASTRRRYERKTPTITTCISTSTGAGTSTALHSSVAITATLTALDSFWQNFPYLAAAIICGIKASAADWVAQKRDYRKRAEKEQQMAQLELQQASSTSQAETLDVTPVIYDPNYNEENEQGPQDTATTSSSSPAKKTDLKRNLAFLVYGSLYQGVTQEHIYNHLYPIWFGSSTALTVVLTKVVFDLLIQTTFVTLPIAYLTKSVIYRYSFQEAIGRYKDDIINHGLLKKYFLLWGPVQCLTFGVVPEHYRVTFIAFVSFFWLIILSSIASKKPAVATASTTTSSTTAEATMEECSLEDGLTCNIDG